MPTPAFFLPPLFLPPVPGRHSPSSARRTARTARTSTRCAVHRRRRAGAQSPLFPRPAQPPHSNSASPSASRRRFLGPLFSSAPNPSQPAPLPSRPPPPPPPPPLPSQTASRRRFLALIGGALAVGALPSPRARAISDGGIDNGSDPYHLRGRLAPRVKARSPRVPSAGPSADADPTVRMGVFGEDEVDEVGHRGVPDSYEDALLYVADPPLEGVVRDKLQFLLGLGCAVGSLFLGINVAERLTVAPRDALPLQYNRNKIRRYCMKRPEKIVMRVGVFSWELAQILSVLVAHKLADMTWMGGRAGRGLRRRQRARLAREGITRLGPGLIKLGQAASTRPDLVGITFASELQLLQDSIFQGFDEAEAFQLIEQELGVRSLRDVFAYIDPQPVAGASLGMVFRAWLFEDEDTSWFKRSVKRKKGPLDEEPILCSREEEILAKRPELRKKRRVAVKVQRPHVAELCTLDFFIIRSFASVINAFLPVRTNLADVVDEYASTVFEELNYVKEANNLNKFRTMYARSNPGTENVAKIYVPRVYPKYSSRRVLTTEWLDIEPIANGMARVRPGDTSLVDTGILSALDQCLTGGFAHCDQHGGNIMKMREPGADGNDRLALVDFGICADIPVFTRQSLACSLMHLMHRDFEALADSFAGMSLMRAIDLEAELAELSSALQDAFSNVTAVSVQRGEEVQPGEENIYRLRLQRFTFIGVAERLITLGVSFPLVFGDYTVSLLRCLSMLEGLAYNANPHFNIVELVYPYVVNMVLEGANEAPFDASLRRLVVDSSGGPGTEFVQLVALERLVRLSRPGALYSHSKASTSEPVVICRDSSVVGYAFSKIGAFVLELTLGQYTKDVIALGKAWIDKVIFRKRVPEENVIHDAAVANVAVVHDVVGRESSTTLSMRHRLRLMRTSLWVGVVVLPPIVGHFFKCLYRSLFRRERNAKVTDGKPSPA